MADDTVEEATVEAEREPNFLLAKVEKRFLRWMAARLPRWILPDDLTALGVLSAVGIAVAYNLSNDSKMWLWVVSALLVTHWFGDSLDGTLARVRGIQRPKYGYYLDHLVDAISIILIGLGLGLSPFMTLAIGVLVVVMYLALSINVYLEAAALNRFSIGYGFFGPTELRLLLIILNTAIALGVSTRFRIDHTIYTGLDIVGVAVVIVMAVLLVARGFKNLRELAVMEPAAKRK